MSTCTPRRRARHHHRRYSWPPSLHLIDVSAIRIPLPDIDDDPFAHFISPPEDDPEPALDSVAFRAGIVATQHTSSKNTEKAYKFRTSIARKWSRFIARYYAKLPHGHSEAKDRKAYVIDKDKAKKTNPTTPISTVETYSNKKTKPKAKTEMSEPTLGHAQAVLAELDLQRRKVRPINRQWRSFSEYSTTLPTILEMEHEDMEL